MNHSARLLTRALVRAQRTRTPAPVSRLFFHTRMNRVTSAAPKVETGNTAQQQVSNDEHYTDDDGRLFGIPKGEKYKRQGWEIPVVIFLYGGLLLLLFGLWLRPDYSIRSWGVEEARRRRNFSEETVFEDEEFFAPIRERFHQIWSKPVGPR